MANRSELKKCVLRMEAYKRIAERYVKNKKILDHEDIRDLSECGISLNEIAIWQYDARINCGL